MAMILPFPVQKTGLVWGLTQQECEAVQSLANILIHRDLVTGISIHTNGPYMCVFDAEGDPYVISRENGMCYLCDADDILFARSKRFDIVLQALEMLLTLRPDGAA